MSAISGIYNRDGRLLKEKQMIKTNNSFSHRGPDGSQVWCKKNVGMGHQMLYTTPESLKETLPYGEDGLIITSDARIDNRRELSHKLGIEDKAGTTDSYFILKAYQEWGEKCPEHLLGDFAFAIWEEDQETLFCARDHMGVKPFYYHQSKDLFIFATELKAITLHPQVSVELNKLKVAFYLSGMDDKTSTFYENIHRLPPGHSIKVESKNSKIFKYWELDPGLEMEMGSEEDYLNKFREIFTEAVKCRLRSAYPVGFELSGGLDSSSVTCTAKTIVSEKLNIFSYITPEHPRIDEYKYIREVVGLGGIEPHYIKVDQISFLNNSDKLLWYNDQPFLSAYMSYLWELSSQASQKNVRIMFRGSGGDNVISNGKYYFKDLFTHLRWIKLLEEMRKYGDVSEIGFSKTLIGEVLLNILPTKLKRLIRADLQSEQLRYLNKDFTKELELHRYLEKLSIKPYLEADNPRKYHHYILNHPINAQILEMTDNTYSAFNIVPVYPFLDKRLVEFCYAIPTDMKFKNGWSRYILRASMEGILPRKIQNRTSKGRYNELYQKNLIKYSKETLDKYLSSNNFELKDFADFSNIQMVYNNLKKGIPDSESSYIWYAILLAIWLNIFNKN